MKISATNSTLPVTAPKDPTMAINDRPRALGKVCVVSLGCEKNTVDSEVIAGMLTRRGFIVSDEIVGDEIVSDEIVSDEITQETDASPAETVIINTCGFIDHAKKESISAILEALELKKAGVVKNVYVAGCLSERYRSELEAEFSANAGPVVDRYFGTQDFEQILQQVTSGRVTSNEASSAMHCGSHDSLLLERKLSTPHHYAYLKISEGCDHPCSFCAIPIMRGSHRSRSIEELEFEAMMLASNSSPTISSPTMTSSPTMRGVKEIVLIAQDSTNYGLDLYGERSIAKLASRLAKVKGVEWIRLMYAYPAQFPLDLLDVMASEEKIVPYLDIPVQHASTAVLKSMRRGITRRATEELIGTIRDRVPGIALRTTLITGYPAEGDREFEELEEFVEQMQFDHLGVFTYSQEDGTTAHPLGDPVPAEEKRRRQARLYDIQAEIFLAKNLLKVESATKLGSIDKILIERKDLDDRGVYYGRTATQAPEVDGEVRVRSNRELALGEMIGARFTGVENDELCAEAVLI